MFVIAWKEGMKEVGFCHSQPVNCEMAAHAEASPSHAAGYRRPRCRRRGCPGADRLPAAGAAPDAPRRALGQYSIAVDL